MGSDKALLKIDGISLIDKSLEILKSICSEIIVSSNKHLPVKNVVRIIPDEIFDIGPMGGIYSCLKHSNTEKNFILSIDSPFVNSQLLQYLFDHSGENSVTVSEYCGKIHPLIGVYSKTFIETMEKEIALKHYKLLKAINETDHKIVTVSEKLSFFSKNLFMNINTPEDYRAAKKSLP